MTVLGVGKKLLLLGSFLGVGGFSCGIPDTNHISNELETKVESRYEHSITADFTHDGISDRIFFDEKELSFYLEKGLGDGTYKFPPDSFYSITSPRLNIEEYLENNLKEKDTILIGWKVFPYVLENGEILNSFFIDEQEHRKIRYTYSREKKKMEITGHLTNYEDDFNGDGVNDQLISDYFALYSAKERINESGENVLELEEIRSFRTSEYTKGTAPVNIYSCVNESDSTLRDILFETKEWMYRMRFSKEYNKWVIHTKMGFEAPLKYYGVVPKVPPSGF